jgi:hypothetical protein
MRAFLAALVLSALPFLSSIDPADARSGGGSSSAGGTVSVRGYTTSKGTYVAPHERTAPDGTRNNNWSTKGNVNPGTGKTGTKAPE